MIGNRILLLILISATAGSVQAQTWKDTVARIEKALAQYKPGNPGYEIAISRNGRTIFYKASGMADLEHTVKMTPLTVIEAGSVSKQFTAAAILLLEQQGKLSLDDDVRKFLPELPACYAGIKLRHMMHHTSGIRDWGDVAALTGWPRSTKTYDNDDALEIICHQKALNNKPGDEFVYSNSNYNLFAIIVKRVSGMSLADFTSKYIFKPAAMLNTSWRDDYKKIVRNRAMAYSKNAGGYYNDMPGESVYGNCGLLTTAGDLLKWEQYYLSGKLGGSPLLLKQITPDVFNNGAPNNYCAGLVLDKTGGWTNFSHNGATAGYRAYLATFPQLDLAIAFLSNTSEFDGQSVAAPIANIFVKNKTTEETKSKAFRRSSADELEKFTGLYRNDKWGEPLQISLHGDTLVSEWDGPLTALNDRDFNAATAELLFDKNGLYYITPPDTIHFSRAKWPDNRTAAYLGQYYSEEAQATVTILMKDDVLTLHLSPRQEYVLIPIYENGLWVKGFDYDLNLLFEKDANGVVTGMSASSYRFRNVKFIKIKNE